MGQPHRVNLFYIPHIKYASSLMAQRMSVALHMAAAWEIARELSLAGAEDEAALFGGGVADSVA